MSKERFIKKLHEQLQFLERSCCSYDQGAESEAYRIAVVLRVLFHKTTQSISLASHLKMEGWELLSSDASLGDFTGYVKIQLALGSPVPVLALPKLGNQFHPMPLYKWWHEQPVCRFEERKYPRRHLVLAAANKDGGAHVDEKLDPFYEDLASGVRSGLNAAGLKWSGEAPYDQTKMQYCQNTHLAMIRQFGHEVLATANHYRWFERLRA